MEPDLLIQELIQKQTIRTQGALLKLLKQEGWKVNQSTLSRHLSRLGIEKRGGKYQFKADYQSPSIWAEVSKAPPNIIVVKTEPGHAQAIAVRIDAALEKSVMGTVGGDDTVLVIVDPRFLDQVAQRLDHLFQV